ncbi:MAG: hypothetical protein CVV63_02130 [Tenericutes bacterium HGW-Tenericutes-8]|nr:MAG: hypothetical protein CVV63_02130 [Tenericutes bacterium HGW-Tenericutes-8]
MKASTKMKVWGLSQLVFAVCLIILGSTVFRDKSWDDIGWKPNFALFAPGLFLAVLSLPVILSGFNPQIAKLSAELQSEVIDYAGEDMKQAISKSANTVIPAVTPSIKQAVLEIKNEKDNNNDSMEEQLIEAKKLLDDHLINEDEYRQMRKNILGI